MSTNKKKQTVQYGPHIAAITATPATFTDMVDSINLPADVKKTSRALGASLNVEWRYGQDKTSSSFLKRDENGKIVDKYSYEEVRNIAGFRRFYGEQRKEMDQADSSIKKLARVDAAAGAAGISLSGTMTPQNNVTFSELCRQLENIHENIGQIQMMPDRNSDLNNRIVDLAKLLEIALGKALEACYESSAVTSDVIYDWLFSLRIPFFIYKKFALARFNTRELTKIEDFLFPKKFQNGFGLTIREMESSDFLATQDYLVDADHFLIKSLLEIEQNAGNEFYQEIAGRNSKNLNENFKRRITFPVPSIKDEETRFLESFGADCSYDKIRPHPEDRDGAVKAKYDLLISFTHAWKCMEHFNFPGFSLRETAKVLGVRIPEQYDLSERSLKDLIKDEVSSTGYYWLNASTNIEVVKHVIATNCGSYPGGFLSGILAKIEAKIYNVKSGNVISPDTALKAGTQEYSEAWKKLAEDNDNVELVFRLSLESVKRMIPITTGGETALITWIEHRLSEAAITNYGTADAVLKARMPSEASQKRVRDFLNLRKGATTNRVQNSSGISTAITEETEKIISKSKEFPNGKELYLIIKKWLEDTFVNKPPLQLLAAKVCINSFENMEYGTYSEDKEFLDNLFENEYDG